jgi:glutaredoxin 3
LHSPLPTKPEADDIGGIGSGWWNPGAPLPLGTGTRACSSPWKMGTPMAEDRSATLYRMVTPDHTCPFGVRAKQLLEQHGFEVDDHVLRSRGEVDAFEAQHNVQTTPQIFISGERIGGSDDLERYLGEA